TSSTSVGDQGYGFRRGTYSNGRLANNSAKRPRHSDGTLATSRRLRSSSSPIMPSVQLIRADVLSRSSVLSRASANSRTLPSTPPPSGPMLMPRTPPPLGRSFHPAESPVCLRRGRRALRGSRPGQLAEQRRDVDCAPAEVVVVAGGAEVRGRLKDHRLELRRRHLMGWHPASNRGHHACRNGAGR